MKYFLSFCIGVLCLACVPTFASSPVPDDRADSIAVAQSAELPQASPVIFSETVYVFSQVLDHSGQNFVPVAIYGSYQFATETSWAPEWGSVATALHYSGHQGKTYRGERAYLVRQ